MQLHSDTIFIDNTIANSQNTVSHETSVGVVLSTTGQRAHVALDGREVKIIVPGKWRIDAKEVRPLAPGDSIEIQLSGKQWILSKILERNNSFIRRAPGPKPYPQVIAVNLNLALIFASAAEPATPFGMVDRLLVAAELGGVTPALIVNKSDLVGKPILDEWQRRYTHAVKQLFLVSAKSGEGLNEIKRFISDGITLLAGSSGVGKSTLVNRMEPGLNIKTGIVSAATGKGRHTTSLAKLHRFQNGWVADTPGLRECAPWNMLSSNLGEAFPEIARVSGNCHFRNCIHEDEKGCEVKSHVGTDSFPIERYESYRKLLSEAKAIENIKQY